MSLGGTALYAELDQTCLPRLVRRAIAAANDLGFELCVHPATGRLLQTLAGGRSPGDRVGETGTGTGAGLAWMVSAADPAVHFLSVEVDADRAAAATEVFSGIDNVAVIHGDAGLLFDRGPFDLLAFDGGWGSGKMGDQRVELAEVVKPHGLVTIDDFTPMREFPPRYQGAVDAGRTYWLTHPDVLATELQVAPDMAVLVARHTPGVCG